MTGHRVEVLTPDSPDLGDVVGAVHAAFSETDTVEASDAGRRARLMREGLLAMAGAYDAQGAVGGGSHSPRGTTTELTGIALITEGSPQITLWSDPQVLTPGRHADRGAA